MKKRYCLVLLLVCGGLSVHAQWSTDASVNTPICTAVKDQHEPAMVGDGAGGAIITWEDERDSSSSGRDIYVQKVNAAGVAQWPVNGVAICTAAGYQGVAAITTDGAGGAIIVWEDFRSGGADIYARRVNGAGVAQWAANGVAICTAAGLRGLPTIASDGTGGAIITWEDSRSGAPDIYAQRVSGPGVVQWTANGVAICTAIKSQNQPIVVGGVSGDAVIVWKDVRNDTSDIYAQKVDTAGVVQWTANGVAICTAPNIQDQLSVVSDGGGGAIIAWRDFRSGRTDIYARRVNAAGVPQWTSDGVPISTVPRVKGLPAIAYDGSGGAIIAWEDLRGNTNYDIYAQKVNAAGVVQWTADGIVVSADTSFQVVPAIVGDGAGGAIIPWEDLRSGTVDIYAQMVDASGVTQWGSDDAAITTAARGQFLSAIVSDGTGGAIMAWEDIRSGTDYDIYAQRVLLNGSLGNATAVYDDRSTVRGAFELGQNFPNPFNPATVIEYALPVPSRVTITVYNLLGQEVRRLLEREENAGHGSVPFDAGGLPSGVYFYRLQAHPLQSGAGGAGAFVQTRKLILEK